MAQHAKKRQFPKIPKGAIIGSIVGVLVVCLTVTAVLLVQNGALEAIAGVFQASTYHAEKEPVTTTGPTATGTTAPTQPSDPTPAEPAATFQRPEEMRGAWLVPGQDYLTADSDDGARVKSQIDAAFKTLREWQFNTVIVPLLAGEKALYPSSVYTQRTVKNADGSLFDPIQYIVDSARQNGLYIYGVVDLRIGADKGPDPSQPDGARSIHTAVAEVAPLYKLDGFLLENYSYAAGKTGSYAAYMASSPGSGFDTYVQSCVQAAAADAIATIKGVDRNLYVGLLTNAVWAHKRVDARGSDTDGLYEELTDGHADTLAWIQEGLADFIMVKDHYATVQSGAAFATILNWWSGVCQQQGIPLYVNHAASRVGERSAGWNSPDELTKQLLACRSAGAWKGSTYTGLATMKKNTTSTNALLQAYKGTLMEEYITRTLTFSSPKTTTFTTLESKVSFQGSADPNFALTMNGKKVELTDHGFFAIDATLTPGKNTFTFVHKNKTVTYAITMKVTVIKSVAPAASANMSLDGGSTLIFSAVAHKGATVTATFAGKKLAMKATPLQVEENGGEDLSDYENYSASYTLPKGIIGKTQALGNVSFAGSYSGLSESVKGGTVTVKALPVPAVDGNEAVLPGVLKDLKPINPNTGGTALKKGTVVIVKSDYAESFSGDTLDDYSRPTNAYLPKGTTDVIVKSVYASSNSYYLLGCGRRVYQSDVTPYVQNGTLSANTLKSQSVEVKKSHTILVLKSNWRVPYDVSLLPQTYANPVKQDYRINSYGQMTEYVDLAFSYTTAVQGTPDLSVSPLFSRAEWIKGTGNTYTLRLYLRQKGQFYGYSVVWDNEGNIHLSFKHPSGTANNAAGQKLKGVKIVLDPGHGGNSVGTAGGSIAEKTMTLKYALLLRDKLQALGATVIMTRTTDINPDNASSPASMVNRVNYARNNGTDLFISIHMNGAGASASGCTLHYFNEYSYGPSQKVYDAMRAVEKTYNIGNRSPSGAVGWDPFYVTRLHDCPAMLIECGFMTNPQNLELLINAAYQEKMTQAMTNAIVAYFASLPTYKVDETTVTSTTTGTAVTTAATTNAATTTGTATATATAAAATQEKEDVSAQAVSNAAKKPEDAA